MAREFDRGRRGPETERPARGWYPESAAEHDWDAADEHPYGRQHQTYGQGPSDYRWRDEPAGGWNRRYWRADDAPASGREIRHAPDLYPVFGPEPRDHPARREMAQGPYAGRGPRGYQRSNERIREEVSDRLSEHPWIDASQVDVAVDNGIVTLTGSVEDRTQKRMAEDVADGVGGVRDVQNQLRIEPSNSGEGLRRRSEDVFTP